MAEHDVDDALEWAMYATVHEYRHPRTGRRGAAALGPVVGMNPTTLSNCVNPRESFAKLGLLEARAVMLATGDHRMLHALAADLGEACWPVPELEFAADSDVVEALTQWQADVGETAAAVRDAFADGRITADEVERVRRELIEDLEKGMALLDVLKGMQEPDAREGGAALRAVR